MILALILLVFQAPPADEEKLRARMRALVEKLGDDDFNTRVAAEKELLGLPARLSPELAAIGKESKDLEVRTRIARVVLPDPWPRLLGGTLGEARVRIEGLTRPDRVALIGRMVADLDGRAPADLVPALEGLLAAPETGMREFALAGLARYPTRDGSRLLPFLEDAALGRRASEALIATGDPSVITGIVDVFVKGGAAAAHAAGVLEQLGPGEETGRVEAAIRERPDLATPGIRILAKAGPRGEDALLGLLSKVSAKGGEIVRALEEMGGEASLPALRAWFKDHPDDRTRDRVLFNLRDREWAREELAEARKPDVELSALRFDEIAAAGGPVLREQVLLWLKEPGVKVGVQKHLLPLLGAVGRAEDGALLAGKLKDRRLRDAAGEALDLLGDPAHARALLDAYKKTDLGVDLQRAVAGLPPDALEDDLLEILSDPDGCQRAGHVVLRLVERRPTPRLCEALYKGVLEGDIGWTSLRAEAARILAATVKPEDRPWIEKLRAHAGRDATVKVCGLLLAVVSGDAKAAPELAGILAGREKFFLPHSVGSGWGASSHVLEWAAPAGARWTRAVAETWRERPQWTEGAIWLAGREVREAQDFLRENRETVEAVLRPRVEAVLAACGDAAALDRLVARARERNHLSPEDESAFVAAAGRDRRAGVVAVARTRTRFSDDPFMRLAALMAHPDGVPIYRAIVARDQTDWGWLNQTDVLTPRCARALAVLKVKDAAGDLRRLLRSQNPRNRAAAAEALGDLGDRAAVPALVRLLDDPFEVEAEGSRNGTDYLTQPKRRVWHAAMEALEKIAGVKSEGSTTADRREFWRAWRERNR